MLCPLVIMPIHYVDPMSGTFPVWIDWFFGTRPEDLSTGMVSYGQMLTKPSTPVLCSSSLIFLKLKANGVEKERTKTGKGSVKSEFEGAEGKK